MKSEEFDSIIFDCDGVLIDVTKSYDTTINKTISYVLKEIADITVDTPLTNELLLKFKSTCSGKIDVSTVPKAEIRWRWSKNWHYPRIETIQLPLAPTLSIPKRAARAKIDGGLGDWRKKPMT